MKVAVVLAAYNPNRSFFVQQIDSLKAQSEKDWICIVSDDSTDEELKTFIQQTLSNDLRFRYFENRGPKGVLFNFENGLKQVPEEVEFICFCDQDDLWVPQKISFLIQELEQNPGKNVAHSDLKLVDGEGRTISDSCWASEKREITRDTDLLSLVIRNQVTGCSMIFRKKMLRLALPFPDSNGAYLHDHWIAVLGHIEGGILNIPQQLVHYRQHGGNVIGASQKANSSLTKKISRLVELKSKSLKALTIRNQLAVDILARIREMDAKQAAAVASALSPLLQPSIFYFLSGLLKTKFQWPEFGLWLQLFVGSLFWNQKKDS